MEKETRKVIEKRISTLINQKMTRGFRWQFMPCFVFEDDDGQTTELHAYSRCVISKDNKNILDSNNIVVPCEGVEPDKDNDYGIGDCVFDKQYWDISKMDLFPLTVLSAEVKDDGTIRMRLSNGCFFAVIPWQNNKNEAWRIFRPNTDEKHMAYHGDGTISE